MTETLDDIMREMRKHAKDGTSVNGYEVGRLADRIERAVKGQTMFCLQACSCEFLAELESQNERLRAALRPIIDVCPDSLEHHPFNGGCLHEPNFDGRKLETAVLKAQRIYRGEDGSDR